MAAAARRGRRQATCPCGAGAPSPLLKWGMSAPLPSAPPSTTESSISKNSGSGAPPASRSSADQPAAPRGAGDGHRVVVELARQEHLVGGGLQLGEQLVARGPARPGRRGSRAGRAPPAAPGSGRSRPARRLAARPGRRARPRRAAGWSPGRAARRPRAPARPRCAAPARRRGPPGRSPPARAAGRAGPRARTRRPRPGSPAATTMIVTVSGLMAPPPPCRLRARRPRRP